MHFFFGVTTLHNLWHIFYAGYALGATAGYEWGLLKGAAAAAFANIQQECTGTLDKEDGNGNAAELVRVAHTLLEELDQNDIKKQECGSLWEEHGEMKDRFPEREPPSVVAEASRRQGEIKSKAVAALEDAGIRIQSRESKI